MANIMVLDQNTIDKIAAGEVVERPSSVVKELLENAIDAKSTAVTVEIRDGGTTFIRITDNGSGIEKNEIPLAFLRHSTSKIRSVEDLLMVSSLGFRGEALSSIAAISQVELITKTSDALTGSRYQIYGGSEKSIEEIGAPEGTTFIVRNLFYNTPARMKFLKTAQTEAAYVANIVEKIALSHPEISIRFIQNNQNKLHTSGNHNIKDLIYTIFGREIAANLISMDVKNEFAQVTGYIGKPVISRGNRNFENYFINGRYIKSNIIAKAIEDAYKPFMMQHKYPFTLLYLNVEPELLDVNVHPTKMELRFRNGENVYQMIYQAVSDALSHKELIPQVELTENKKEKKEEVKAPEPFEKKRIEFIREEASYMKKEPVKEMPVKQTVETPKIVQDTIPSAQLNLFEEKLLEPAARKKHKLIGQLFETYWLVEFNEQLFIIDQHAAHEKVLYEKTMKTIQTREYTSQMINPPIILTLNTQEEILLKNNLGYFNKIGFEIEHFGGKDYAVRSVPDNLFSIAQKDLLIEMLDEISIDGTVHNPDIILEHIATMSCKAAVKGNHKMSSAEADKLIDELLKLDNPYACPHGRPTIISMSKYELEKKFKRII